MARTGIEKTFRELSLAPSGLALEMIYAALDEEDVVVLDEAAHALLSPRFRNLIDRVIQSFDRLSGMGRIRILDRGEMLIEYIRRRYFGLPAQTRRWAVEVLVAIGTVDAAELLLRVIRDPDPSLAERVIEWVQDEIESLTCEAGNRISAGARSRRRQAVARAIGHVLDGEDPGCFSFLLESLLRIPPENEWILKRTMARGCAPDQKRGAAQILVEIFETTLEPNALRFFLVVLCDRQLEGKVRPVFRRRFAEEGFSDVVLPAMSRQHVPDAANVMSLFPELPWVEEVCRIGRHLSDRQASVLVASVLLARKGLEERVFLLRTFHKHPGPVVLLRVIDACRELPPKVAGELLFQLLQHSNEEVVLPAVECVLEMELPERIEWLSPLSSSPMDQVREMVNQHLAHFGLEQLLDPSSSLGPDTRKRAAVTIGKLDEGIVDDVLEMLETLPSERKVQALLFLDNLDKAERAQDVLGEIVADPSRHVRATVVTLLGHIGNVEAVMVLLRCLGDPDRRVLANAVQSLDELENPRLIRILIPFARHPHNRVRANAIRALLRLGIDEVTPLVSVMLGSHDPSMRLSGLWVCEDCRLVELSDRLQEIRRRDSNEQVRQRAARALEVLAQESDRPGTGEGSS